MKKFRFIMAGIICALFMSSCKDIDTLQKDPGAITAVKPQLVLTGILLNVSDSPWSQDHQHNQFMVYNMALYGNQSYGWSTGSFGGYDILRNVLRLEIEAEKEGDLGAPYLALAKFFRAYFFCRMTDMFGDIPTSEALQGTSSGNFTPKYDSQKDVYRQILSLLEEANTMITPQVQKNAVINGDFYYANNLAKWQKLINSLRLRILINLSKRADDTPDLRIKEQFSEIISNPEKYPLIVNNEDNFQLVYNANSRDNNYPLWPADGIVVKNDTRSNLGDTYVSLAKRTQDPRLFVVAWPTDSAKKSGDVNYAKKFTSFRGGKTGMIQADLEKLSVAGKLSMINFDYWMASAAGIPSIQFGASETHFIIAEGINRGWAAGDAKSHYDQAITASMKFFKISDADIASYLTRNSYLGNTSAGLTQLLEQKYLSFFENSGKQAFYQNRRTGIPKFDIGPSNSNNGQIPTRWAYPTSEYTVNEVNVKAAIKAQFSGADTQNGVLWVTK